MWLWCEREGRKALLAIIVILTPNVLVRRLSFKTQSNIESFGTVAFYGLENFSE